MNSKSKFKKLQLPKSSRHKTNSQISNFFSTSNSEECSSLLKELPKTSFSQLEENSNANSSKSWTSEDIILIVSDDEEDISKLNNYGNSKFNLVINKGFEDKTNLCNEELQSEDKPKMNTERLHSRDKTKLINEELQSQIKTKQLARTTVISKFFNNSVNDDYNDFENPPVNSKPNRVTKSKSTKLKSIPKTKRKKQQSIKSAFIKNEEIFSELMAQHSIADDINPDELQMALAISMSEITTNGICQEEDSKESLARCSENSNKIRDRLQEFGFKTSSNSRDYDLSYFLPGKKKTKWANKFTALTLRNPDRQKQKLDNQVETFIKKQELLKDKSKFIDKLNKDYVISSNYLNKFKAEPVSIKLDLDDFNRYSLDMFYVQELFELSSAKAGHLMKDLNKIPGRDFSPKKYNSQNKIGNIETENEELSDKQFGIYLSNETTVENKNLSISDIENYLGTNEIKCKIIEQQKEISENIKMSESFDIRLESEEVTLLSPKVKKTKLENEAEQSSIKLYNDARLLDNRLSSPDLFADYEVDISNEPNVIENERAYKNNNLSGFEANSETNNAFQNLSSDEVKIDNDINDKITEVQFTENHTNNISAINNRKPSSTTSIINDDLIDLTRDAEPNNDCNSTTNSKAKYFKNDANSFQSQLNSTQEDSIDDCIILSDDEVNYSIQIANTTNYKKFTDLTLSSSDTEEAENNQFTTKHYDEKNMQNFSFITLIEDNRNIKNINLSINEKFSDDNKNLSYLDILEENENGEITASQTSLNQQLHLYEISPIKSPLHGNSKIIAPNSSEFLNPIKITPTKLFRNQPRFSKHFSPCETTTCNSSRKLNFALADDSMCNNSTERVSENDDDMCFDLTKLRSKFGIKDINNKRKTINCSKTLSESYITPIKTHSENAQLKKFSSSNKFKEFIEEDDEYFSDMDEIDQLVHDTQLKSSIFNKPKGIENLLTADIKTKPTSTCGTNSSINVNEKPEEITSNGRTYLVSTQNIPGKPDYNRMDSPTRLKELHKYGVKPLKKKQAVIMLEYIYNQTHPIIVNNNSQQFIENFSEANRELINKHNNIINTEIIKKNENHSNHKLDNFKLRDCFGSKLLEDDGFMFGENIDEIFIFQTNISKKISTALLPFHVAWYNLIKSNYNLKESILHYEPLDLQEIYLFFKRIGYRYDPKDIKRFFDKHCIIFRYDLNQDPNANRHIKKKNISSTISQKNKQINLDWLL